MKQLEKTPLEVNFGELSIIFLHILNRSLKAKLKIGWGNTWQTLQLYNEEWHEKVIGAIQYEGSNDFSNKPPHIVCWRFYRNNLPSIVKDQLENINEFRRDTNKGPNVDSTAQSITFKFQGRDNSEYEIINKIAGILSS